MTRPLLLALLVAAPRGPAPPGVYYEQITQSVVGTQPRGAPVRTRVYSTGRRMRLESGEAPGGPALVLRLDEGRGFRLDPEAKTASLVDLTRLRAQSQMDLSVAGEALGATEEGAARTTPLRATKVVAGRTCRGFQIASPQASLEVYVADVGVGIEAFTDFLEWSGARQSLGALLDELRGLPGFPLETRVRAKVNGENVTTVTTVTKIELGPLAPALFEVPAGFRMVEGPAPLEED